MHVDIDVGAVFKIEVFNAFQMQFGLSKYHSLKTTLQNTTPNLKMKMSLEVLNIIFSQQEPSSEGHCHYKK